MDILALVLFSANLFCAIANVVQYTQTGSVTTLAVGVANGVACILLAPLIREEMNQKNQGIPYKESLDKWE